MSPRIGSLFAGYGGLEMGVSSVLGGHPAWFSEFDDHPSHILAHHHPDVPNHGDITQIDWATVEPIDVLTGGFPCQDVSHAGARAGLRDGTRTGLWSYMRDAIDRLRPRLVVAENVRGLLSADADSSVEPCPWCVGDPDTSRPMRALGAVLADLADLGYDAFWCGLRAADVGAPHGRFRVFIFAWPAADTRGEAGIVGAGLCTDEPTGNGWGQPARSDRPTRSVALPPTIEALRMLPTPRASDGEKGGPNQRGSSGDLMLPSAVALLPTPVTTDAKGARNSTSGRRADSTAHIGDTLGDIIYAGRFGDYGASAVGLMPTPSVADVEGGRKSRSGERSDELLLNGLASAQRFGDYTPAIARWEAMTRPAPAPTEPTGKNGAHRLSARFVEWMMGLPEGWVTDPAIWTDLKPSTARNAQLKALGNGVVPQQAAEATRRFLAWAHTEAATR